MNRKLLALALTLTGSLLFVATAQAINIPGCGEFTLVAQNKIGFEQGPTTIDGDVLVTAANGQAALGAHNIINGKLFAANIFLGTGASVSECHGAVSGPGKCGVNGTAIFPFNPPGPCLAAFPPSPLVTPAAAACVTGLPTQTISGCPATLTPGCYGSLRLKTGACLELAPGVFPGPVFYTFKDVRLETGSELRSASAGNPATVNVNGLFVTEPNVAITDIIVNSASQIGAGVALGNANTLTNMVFNAPFTHVHPRTGTALRCSALVGEVLTVQPINAQCAPTDILCTCPAGTHFEDSVSRICVPND